MPIKRGNPSSGWISYEVIERDAEGEYTVLPFSDSLAISGTVPTQALTKMRMTQELGWPQARYSLKDDYGHPLIVAKDDLIWLLKCKPSCWRLYFYVRQDKGRIIYVHAVCKKTDDEDPAEAIRARAIADNIGPGRSAITPFEFPIN